MIEASAISSPAVVVTEFVAVAKTEIILVFLYLHS